jgi:putative ABC transport system permease protein
MNALLSLAARSAWNRRFVLGLVVASIALSTFLLLGIERVRQDVRHNFAQAVSGTDLIVGPRTGSVQLLLYAVFHLGGGTQNIRWDSVQALAQQRQVAWVVPISLGDTHRGFPVVGTTADYFVHFRHGEQQSLALAQGRAFTDAAVQVHDAVVGAEVARRLGLTLGQRLVLSHGDGAFADNDHTDDPFTVVGVLQPTGTPVDRSVHIPLGGVESVHGDWVAGMRMPHAQGAPAQEHDHDHDPHDHDLTPRSVTAALVGLKNRAAVFSVQRWVAGYGDEALMAVLPGVALDELWTVIGAGERALLAVSVLVSVVSLAGLVAVILAGLNERRRELAILRSVGAGPWQMLGLLAVEGALVTGCGVVLGAVVCYGLIAALGDWAGLHWGVSLRLGWPGPGEWLLLCGLLMGGWLASLVPGYRAYRLSLADGLSPRI